MHIQLYNELKNDILKNYKEDDKLPSIRKISSLYNLSKNTVENSYSQLVVEGYIQSYPRSAYRVNKIEQLLTKEIKEQKVTNEKKKKYLYDFVPVRLDTNTFPLKIWKRLFTKVVTNDIDFGIYPNGKGEEGLRKEIQKYIHNSRAVNSSISQIVITNCFADSMGIVAKMLKDTTKDFFMEDPGYNIAKKVFESYSYKIEKISLDNDGINLKELENTNAKLVYLTPSHQYPTGVSIPINNRLKLLKWAKENDAYIIEDDYDSELTYDNRPIPSLQALDTNERVIYLGTLSKALSPTLRMGYMVIPNSLLPQYDNLFDSQIAKVSVMMQKTLELFMKDGYWEKHIRKIRTINKKKHKLMKDSLVEHLGSTFEIISKGGGLSILIKAKNSFDWEKLNFLCEENSIKIYYLQEQTRLEALRMGFGGFKDEDIGTSVKEFSKLWHQCIIK